MSREMRVRIGTALALSLLLLAPAALAIDEQNVSGGHTSAGAPLAIHGYDPVAYFTEGKPVPGDKEFEHEWNGATWRFASAEHRDLFRKDPERYAPQYGGYCAWAVAHGSTAPGDPEVWKIVDDKLYVNVNRDIADQWEKNIPGFVARADAKWPGLLAGS